jgi:hypothetical protein
LRGQLGFHHSQQRARERLVGRGGDFDGEPPSGGNERVPTRPAGPLASKVGGYTTERRSKSRSRECDLRRRVRPVRQFPTTGRCRATTSRQRRRRPDLRGRLQRPGSGLPKCCRGHGFDCEQHASDGRIERNRNEFAVARADLLADASCGTGASSRS